MSHMKTPSAPVKISGSRQSTATPRTLFPMSLSPSTPPPMNDNRTRTPHAPLRPIGLSRDQSPSGVVRRLFNEFDEDEGAPIAPATPNKEPPALVTMV